MFNVLYLFIYFAFIQLYHVLLRLTARQQGLLIHAQQDTVSQIPVRRSVNVSLDKSALLFWDIVQVSMGTEKVWLIRPFP